ncbi:MAG: recombinase family protein [Candidatus Sulfotelmatobacter sp.]
MTRAVPIPSAHRCGRPNDQLIPAAQYLRMSDEDQQYSIANQRLQMAGYAKKHGFGIIKVYEDPGKTGVIIKHRKGLSALLKDVVSGEAKFKAILVYDVSRWGRFQNPDEAAHYEFMCVSSGIPLHYCAEQFDNDGSASSAIVKALKRSMAAEFSRELGEKVFLGKTGLAKLGFLMGGPPGYGYRRRMVSADGKHKLILKEGEQKSLKTDRITLVVGPRKEADGVRMIFSLAAEGSSCTEIVRALDRKGVLLNGRQWNDVTVLDILSNPKYIGSNIWHRRTCRLHSPIKHVDPQFWIRKPLAFPPIVDQQTFDRAQATLQRMRDSHWSAEKILSRARRLLKAKGRLSENLLKKARGMPCVNTIKQYFGTYRGLYERVGYQLEAKHVFRVEQGQRSACLRRALGDELKTLFPDHIVVNLTRRGKRSVLQIDDTFMVSILFCGQDCTVAKLRWVAVPAPAERDYVTLICLLNRRYDRVLRYYVAPKTGQWNSLRLRSGSQFLREAVRLECLSEFYATVRRIWEEKSSSLAGSPSPISR